MQVREWYQVPELAGLPGLPSTARRVRARAERENWAKRRRQFGRGWEYHFGSLPENAQAALLVKLAPPPAPKAAEQDRSALWANYERQPAKRKEIAERRLKAIQTALTLIENGSKSNPAWQATADAFDYDRATLLRWYQSVRKLDKKDWLPALLPKYRGGAEPAEVTPEAWELFKALFLTDSKPSAEACRHDVVLKSDRENLGWKIPSTKTLLRKLRREIPRAAIIFAREGSEALARTFPAQERDRSMLRAMQLVNADGHKFDVFVRFPDGEIRRPLMVAWQDIFSGKLLAYRVDHSEHTGLVRLSFGDLVEKWGIPDEVLLDNGRAFASKYLSGGVSTRYRFKVKEEDPIGVFPMMGIKVRWATPYHGQAKPIERMFRDLCDSVSKFAEFAGAYTGNSPDAKPESYGSRAVPLDRFLEVLASKIAAHNARPGRRSDTCRGRSLDETFNESYTRYPPQRATVEQRRLWMLGAENLFAARLDGSVRIAGNRYWSEALSQLAGTRVVARFDPDNLHGNIHIYCTDGRYIGEAECVGKTGFLDQEGARRKNKAFSVFKRKQRELLDAEVELSAAEAAKAIPLIEPAPVPDTSVVRPVFDRPRKVVNGADEDPAEDVFTQNMLRLAEARRERTVVEE